MRDGGFSPLLSAPPEEPRADLGDVRWALKSSPDAAVTSQTSGSLSTSPGSSRNCSCSIPPSSLFGQTAAASSE